MSSSLRSVQGVFPKLQSACDGFAAEAGRISKERKTNRLTLSHHTSLLEILEVPQLMDTLVRNGFYEQALELHGFAQGLGRMHPQLAVVQGIVEDVEATAQGMKLQLLQLLRSDVQLAVCLRVVGYLRRLESYDEAALRSVFLACRDRWLLEAISDIPEENSSSYLVKLADSHRVHVFDIVTQYQSIFGDDAEVGQEEAHGLLCEWVGRKMDAFLHSLEQCLPQVTDSTLLNNILKQAMYCGLSLSRVGVDFRVMVLPLFTSHILGIMETNLEAIHHPFQQALQRHDWRSAAGGGSQADPQPQAADMAPVGLLDHAPLAAASNYLSMCFNDLRQCAPLALSSLVWALLEGCMTRLVEAMIAVVQGMDRDLPQRPPAADAMAKAMAFLFLPYTVQCHEGIFGTTRGLKVEPLIAKLNALAPVAAAPVPPPPGAPPPQAPKAAYRPPPAAPPPPPTARPVVTKPGPPPAAGPPAAPSGYPSAAHRPPPPGPPPPTATRVRPPPPPKPPS